MNAVAIAKIADNAKLALTTAMLGGTTHCSSAGRAVACNQVSEEWGRLDYAFRRKTGMDMDMEMEMDMDMVVNNPCFVHLEQTTRHSHAKPVPSCQHYKCQQTKSKST